LCPRDTPHEWRIRHDARNSESTGFRITRILYPGLQRGNTKIDAKYLSATLGLFR